MNKKSRITVVAHYENYTDKGSSRNKIEINDKVNIMIKLKPLIWSKKKFRVVYIDSPFHVFLHDVTDKNEMVIENYYHLNGTIYKTLKLTELGWLVRNINTTEITYLRNYILKKKMLERVFKIAASRLRLQNRLRYTSRGWTMFNFSGLKL